MNIRVRKTAAAEAVATWACDDINEIVESAYQPSLFFNPTIFCVGDDYACAMKGKRKPPTKDRDGDERGFVWKPVFEWRGFTVYLSKSGDME